MESRLIIRVVAAQIPNVQCFGEGLALRPCRAKRVQSLRDGPHVQLEIDIDHRHLGASPPPPLLATRHTHRQVEQAPRLIAFARSTKNHLAPLVQYSLDDLRRRCTKVPVVYINLELHVWAIAERLNALCAA